MAAAVDSARAGYLMAARKRDAGRPFTRDAAVAKMIATDAAMKVTTDAVQVLGGYGYTRDFPAERYMREAKVTQIFEGTNQIQRLVIGSPAASRAASCGGMTRLATTSSWSPGAPPDWARPPCGPWLAAGASVVIMDLPSSPGADLAAELGDRVRFVGGRRARRGAGAGGGRRGRSEPGVAAGGGQLRRGGHARVGSSASAALLPLDDFRR